MMTDLDLATKILGIVYEQWFQDCTTGVPEGTITEKLNEDKNEVSKAIKVLESVFLIQHDDLYWWKITNFGIDNYEGQLPVSTVSKRTSQRKLILEALKEVYDQDTEKDVSNQDLETKTGINDFFELYGQVRYLEDKGLIKLELFLGKSFLTKLNGAGALSLEQHEYDGVKPMTNAYSILFSLENHLRRFIEKKLRETYGSDWWSKGISSKQREISDSRKTDESTVGWKVSEINSDMEYLQFPDLSKIITTQWSVFQPIFKDQSKIQHRLNELEIIRNSIAHTRTLSLDAINRLEQYNSDILNLTK